jgi:hypothetical protein
MRGSLCVVAAGVLLVGAVGHSGAEGAGAPAKAGEPGFATVIGISRGDMLNIRAVASATGMTIARVPNGTSLKVAGCEMAGGNLWCRVEDAGDATATGWTPARYLSGYEAQATEAASAAAQSADPDSIMSSDATFGIEVVKPKRDARQQGFVASFYIEPLPVAAPGADAGEWQGGVTRTVATIASPTSLTDFGAPDAAGPPFIALPVEPGEGTDIVLTPASGEPAHDAAD